MKLFRPSNVAIARQCQELFGFQLPSVTFKNAKELINLLVKITLLIICCAKYVANLYKLCAH